ncbi:MAG: RNase A-like domain-containing protein [Elusimicrobiota bacterium]
MHASHRPIPALSWIAAVLFLSIASAQADDSCATFKTNARMLRNGANNCDAATGQGQMSSCQVRVLFSLAEAPGLAGSVPTEVPWLASTAFARELADKLDAIRCVQNLKLKVSPSGPLKPGDSFTITAEVTMANGASPEGLEIAFVPDDPQLVSFSDAPGDANRYAPFATKKGAVPALAPLRPGAVAAKFGPARMLTLTGIIPPGATGTGTQIEGRLDQDKNKGFSLKLSAAGTAITILNSSCGLAQGEDVLSRFVDGTKLAPGFLISHEEGPLQPEGGHTMRDHIAAATREQTLHNLERQLAEGKPAASAFFAATTAENVIRSSVIDHESRIAAWLATPDLLRLALNLRTLPLPTYAGSSTDMLGFGITADNHVPRDLFMAKVVLRIRKDCKIFTLTSYPSAK